MLAVALEVETVQTILLEFPVTRVSTKQVAIGHVRPALDAGFIVTNDATSRERDNYLDRRMTWAGHEFIQADRNSKICSKMRWR